MEATAATLERRVRVIPATRKPEELHRDHDGKMRVAAYCRVSTVLPFSHKSFLISRPSR